MIQRNIEQYACTTFYLTSIYTSDVEFFTQVTAYFTAFQVQTVRPGSRYLERFAVHIEVLFYGTPVVRIDQLRCLGSSVCIVYADYSIGNVALHVVGTSRHQQISM